jgi:hypothetical protein
MVILLSHNFCTNVDAKKKLALGRNLIIVHPIQKSVDFPSHNWIMQGLGFLRFRGLANLWIGSKFGNWVLSENN